MSKYVEFINAVRDVSGAKKTSEVLAKYTGDSDIATFLHMALDPQFNWFQSEIDPKAAAPHPYTQHQEDIVWFMQTLGNQFAQGMPRGAAGKAWLAEAYHQVNEAEQPLCHHIIERNLKAGCGAKTVKKAFGKHIVDVLPYMRCELFKHADGKKKATYAHFDWEAGVDSELKADGAFFNGIAHTVHDPVLRTRQGTIIPNVHQMEDVSLEVNRLGAIIEEVYGIITPVIHGEMLATTTEDGLILYAGTKDEIEFAPNELLPREVSNGLINSLIKTGESLPSGVRIHAQVWDVIPLAEWEAGKGTMQRKTRRNILAEALVLLEDREQRDLLEIIPCRVVYSPQEAAEHFAEMTSQGLEGTVIKNPNGLFKDGNSKDQLKVKIAFDVDLEIVGYNEADQKGKYADLFGSLELKSRDGLLQVGCSGMSVALRNEIFAAKDRLVGKIVTVTTNGIMPASKHNKGVRSLFLPRLAKDEGSEIEVRVIEHRLDKTEADSMEEIEAAYQLAILGSKEC